ncbi:hypothetical protein BD626DRAFT_509222 [Schizophyllum amplum]|uniref:Tetratricopeptide SHNi-TPR domain-containing protein n=1 Tax=Schizophyllum amplum TaxID=97359 RepID=A0A550C2U4_9AGAR|nr:hypothetical protein BD626DRAFT_509222 [Auriculariopsis ampla]
MSASQSTSEQPQPTLESAVDNAKRAFALKKYEEAVDHYATALEIAIEQYPEDALEVADLHFAYGKALLENAISNSGVLGKAEPEGEKDDEPAPSGGFLSFSGDAEDADEDGAVDLFAQAAKEVARADAAQAEGEAAEDEEEDDDAEPEDDFNAAWEVLEVARSIYDKRVTAGDDTLRLKLAETYISLGDVSLETEKFDQAILDYEEGAKLKDDLLPLSSRQLAEAHYKLSMVLDMTSGRLSDAIRHAEMALKSLESRQADLKEALEKGEYGKPAPAAPATDAKGKGKASAAPAVGEPLISTLSKTAIEAELKDLESLLEDLGLKRWEKELNGATASGISAAMPVNDLSGMVKKKKKPAAAAPAESSGSPPGKRKAEEELNGDATSAEKKLKLES